VQVGLAVPGIDRDGARLAWAEVAASVRRAEALGFDSVWVDDQPGPGGTEPVAALGALARLTDRVRLGTLALHRHRNPAVLAKELATLDVISQGRLVVGLGGAPAGPEDALIETLMVLRGMFGGGPFTFRGTTCQVVEATCLPRPVQLPAPPLLVVSGGEGPIELAGAHADGWMAPWGTTVDEWVRCSRRLDQACERAGRDPGALTRSVAVLGPLGPVGAIVEELRQWKAAGVSTVVVSPGGTPLRAPTEADVDMSAAACSLLGL